MCAPKTETRWAGPHLGSQLTCMVGLDFLHWVVLNTKAQLNHFSLLWGLSPFLTLFSLCLYSSFFNSPTPVSSKLPLFIVHEVMWRS